jgi:heterodisulfide reductase subunit A-like polyferredoxin
MGERCEGNASCVPICPVQAKYNALKTLKKALYKVNKNQNFQRNHNIQVQAQSVVYKLSVDVEDQEKSLKFISEDIFQEKNRICRRGY